MNTLRKFLLLTIPLSALILVLAWVSILGAAQPIDLDIGVEADGDRGPGNVIVGPGDVIVGPDQSGSVDPGETITYTLTVTNATNGEKTYDVTYSSDQGFSVMVSATITVLGIPGQADGTAQLDVKITAPPEAAGDIEDTTTITVTDPNDLDFPDTATLQTTVNTIAGVSISPPRSGSAGVGESVAYSHTVTNEGNADDIYLILTDSSENFIIDTPVAIDVNQGASKTLYVTVTVPGGTAIGVTDITSITVQSSLIDTNVRDLVADTTTVLQKYDVSISPETDAKNGNPDAQVVYEHTVTNEGNETDTINMTANSSPGSYITEVSPQTLTDVPAGGQRTVYVTVTVPSNANSGDSAVTTVTATSASQPQKSASATDTTTVGQDFAVSVQANDTNQSGDPGQEVYYEYTVTNEGNGPDTINVSASSNPAWVTDWNPTSQSNVPKDGTFTVSVTVTIPLTGDAGITSQTTVIATSQGDTNENDTAQNTTTANLIPDVELSPPTRSGTTFSGQDIVYTHTLTNLGNGTDTFNFTYTSTTGFAVSVPSPVMLAKGESQVIEVAVIPAQSLADGAIGKSGITATSNAQASVFDTVIETTTVRSFKLYIPVVSNNP